MSRLISMSFNTRHLLIIVINIGGVSFFFRITDFGRASAKWFTVHIRWDRIDKKIMRMRMLRRWRICPTLLSDGSVLVISPANSRTG